MSENNVTFHEEEGYIEETWDGDITLEYVEDMTTSSQPLMSKLRSEGKPVLMLLNITDMGQTDSKARATSIKMLNNMDFDKMAVYGSGGVFQRNLVNLLVKAASMGSKIKYLDSRESAIEWLLND